MFMVKGKVSWCRKMCLVFVWDHFADYSQFQLPSTTPAVSYSADNNEFTMKIFERSNRMLVNRNSSILHLLQNGAHRPAPGVSGQSRRAVVKCLSDWDLALHYTTPACPGHHADPCHWSRRHNARKGRPPVGVYYYRQVDSTGHSAPSRQQCCHSLPHSRPQHPADPPTWWKGNVNSTVEVLTSPTSS